MIIRPDKDYTLNYLKTTPRYRRFTKAIYPERVYPDPVYPQEVAIVELPFSLNFRCDQVFWHASRLSHRLPVYCPDRLEFFAMLSSADATGKVLFEILFVGYEVFTIFQRWLYFVDKQGVNLLQRRYQQQTPPASPGINYEHGCIFGDHPHLRKILAGLTVG